MSSSNNRLSSPGVRPVAYDCRTRVVTEAQRKFLSVHHYAIKHLPFAERFEFIGKLARRIHANS